MTSQAKVSIIIPVYNVEKYLRECLDSVVNQTIKEIEIIIVNDGSTDSSPAICDEYAKNDSRITVIHKSNSGYGASMNRGLQLANGEYIGIVESDDFAELNMFEKLYNTAKENNLDIARCNFFFYNSLENINKKSDSSWVDHNEVYAPLNNTKVFYQQPSIWSAIYRKDLLDKNNIIFLETPGASYQDTSFAFKTYAMSDKFMMIEEALLHYRTDNENSSINSTGKVYCVCDEYEEIRRYSKENGIYDKVKTLIPHIQFSGYKWNFNRLKSDFKWAFLKRWGSEYAAYFKERSITRKVFRRNEFKKAFFISFFPYVYKNRMEL